MKSLQLPETWAIGKRTAFYEFRGGGFGETDVLQLCNPETLFMDIIFFVPVFSGSCR